MLVKFLCRFFWYMSKNKKLNSYNILELGISWNLNEHLSQPSNNNAHTTPPTPLFISLYLFMAQNPKLIKINSQTCFVLLLTFFFFQHIRILSIDWLIKSWQCFAFGYLTILKYNPYNPSFTKPILICERNLILRIMWLKVS